MRAATGAVARRLRSISRGSVHAARPGSAPACRAAAAISAVALVIVFLSLALGGAIPALAGLHRDGAVARVEPVARTAPAGPVARGTSLVPVAGVARGASGAGGLVLLAVAGDAGTGVAAGEGVLWWSVTTHQAWASAAGVDTNLTYTAVVKTASRYLAVADDGSAWISGDAAGKSFLRTATASRYPLRAIAKLGSALVAVGDSGAIARCPDLNGAIWTASASRVTAGLRGIAWNGVSTVAVGEGGTLLRAGSAGTEWQLVPINETRDFLAVIADPPGGFPGIYLAVGREGAAWRGEADGLTWTRLSGFTAGALNGAAWLGPAAVVVGDAGSIHVSPGDFDTWDPVVSPVTSDLRAVAFTGNDLLAVGADGTILWSRIGYEWRRAVVPVPIDQTSWGRLKGRFRR